MRRFPVITEYAPARSRACRRAERGSHVLSGGHTSSGAGGQQPDRLFHAQTASDRRLAPHLRSDGRRRRFHPSRADRTTIASPTRPADLRFGRSISLPWHPPADPGGHLTTPSNVRAAVPYENRAALSTRASAAAYRTPSFGWLGSPFRIGHAGGALDPRSRMAGSGYSPRDPSQLPACYPQMYLFRQRLVVEPDNGRVGWRAPADPRARAALSRTAWPSSIHVKPSDPTSRVRFGLASITASLPRIQEAQAPRSSAEGRPSNVLPAHRSTVPFTPRGCLARARSAFV